MPRSTLSDPNLIDEEELQDLSEQGAASSRAAVPPKKKAAAAAAESHWVRDGTLELYVPLVVLIILGLAIIFYNLTRLNEVGPCDPSAPRAKHFYCYNISDAGQPGVHKDNDH